jgi:hypothetical protein
VASEDISGFKVRLAAAKRGAKLKLDQPVGIYTFPEPIDLRDPVSVSRFTEYIKDQGHTFFEAIVVDTYAAATPGAAENSSEDTTLAMSHARQWCDQLQVTVILIHHTNAGGSRERGHSSMRGAADAMIQLTPVDDVIQVESSKQGTRDRSPIVLKLVADAHGGCVFRLASQVLPESGLTVAQAKCLGVLRDPFSAEGATKSEWQRACQDVPERTFHRVAKVVIEKRYATQAGRIFA